MTKQEIFYNRLGVYVYELSQRVIKGENGRVNTCYEVIWKCKYLPESLVSNSIRQQVSKEEYEFLLKEYDK